MSPEAWWWLTLGAGLVVVAVVAVLLAAIVRSARRIAGALEQVWVAGPRVAANTATLDQLRWINDEAGRALAAARRIGPAAARLTQHAEGCSGCPRCVRGWSA